MHLPNYKDGSIVNLMASLEKAMGGDPMYNPLKLLNPDELSSKNIVLLMLDGLGYEWLRKHGKKSTFTKHLKGKITSILPSTTAACVTTFSTGVAPQQHAITGWFMYLRELGIVSAILPFVTREGRIPLKANARSFFDQSVLAERIEGNKYNLLPEDLVEARVTAVLARKAKLLPYKGLQGYFKEIGRVVELRKKRKLIYAYWPEFDSLCHHYGTKSKEVLSHFKELDKGFSSLLSALEGTDTTVIVTADHGLLDTPKSKVILLENHPKLAETLVLPLCGESRWVYCYVYPKKAKQFEQYVKKHFRERCWLYKSKNLVKRGYFGLFEPNKKLFDRIGDYILVMKENYAIKDFVPGEPRRIHKARHGGVSKEEMYVPLIVAQP